MQYIISKYNAKFKNLKKLNLKKYRDDLKLFIAEGEKFTDYLENAVEVVLSESKQEKYFDKYPKLKEKKIIVLSDNLFNELSFQKNNQGILFLFEKKELKIENLIGDLLILDEIQDPGNLGTIIRTALAAGYTNIILTNDSVDCYNLKVIRATMGAIFNVNIVYSDRESLKNYLLKNENEYNIISTSLSNDSIDYTDMQLYKKNAFIFGNEGHGVSKDLVKISNQKIKIKIYGDIESLNLAIATSIILYKTKEILKK